MKRRNESRAEEIVKLYEPIKELSAADLKAKLAAAEERAAAMEMVVTLAHQAEIANDIYQRDKTLGFKYSFALGELWKAVRDYREAAGKKGK